MEAQTIPPTMKKINAVAPEAPPAAPKTISQTKMTALNQKINENNFKRLMLPFLVQFPIRFGSSDGAQDALVAEPVFLPQLGNKSVYPGLQEIPHDLRMLALVTPIIGNGDQGLLHPIRVLEGQGSRVVVDRLSSWHTLILPAIHR